MNISWQDLTPIIEVCAPILAGLSIFYFQLKKEIKENRKETDEKIESLRKEMDHKFDKVDQKFDKVDQKLDRIIELFVIKNIPSSRPHINNPKGKTA